MRFAFRKTRMNFKIRVWINLPRHMLLFLGRKLGADHTELVIKSNREIIGAPLFSLPIVKAAGMLEDISHTVEGGIPVHHEHTVADFNALTFFQRTANHVHIPGAGMVHFSITACLRTVKLENLNIFDIFHRIVTSK